MTSSLVKNALANTKYENAPNGKAEPVKQEPAPSQPAPKSNIDEELEKIAAQLDVRLSDLQRMRLLALIHL